MTTIESRTKRDRRILTAFVKGMPAREIARRRRKSRRWVYQRIEAMGFNVAELRRLAPLLLAPGRGNRPSHDKTPYPRPCGGTG
jgi:hypothetical protein